VSFSIQPLEAQDLDGLFRLAAGSPEAPHWTLRDYEQILRAQPPLHRCALVAFFADELVGFVAASYLMQESAAEMESLVVAESYRRRGIGAALIEACKAWASAAGASVVRLEVRASNTAAIALYHRQGFSTAGVRNAYYSAPEEDALLLQAHV
jgi:[ribosomal protein S18]-alanine N-acetyltransferase